MATDNDDYEYEYEYGEKTYWKSEYVSEYKIEQEEYESQTGDLSKVELIVFKAYWTIRKSDRNVNWTDDQCMARAYTWFQRHFDEYGNPFD